MSPDQVMYKKLIDDGEEFFSNANPQCSCIPPTVEDHNHN